MKLKRIIVENLNSLYGRHEVDLEQDLGGDSLFLIHGPTGSGKSTLMDAVSLALFGVTPRLGTTGSSGDGNPQRIMSRGTGYCHASLEFSKLEAGERRTYRAEWSTHRARKRPDGAFQNVTRSLSRQGPDGAWDTLIADHRAKVYGPVFNNVLEGFDVHDFNRSMLLAQGQFDAFMAAGESDRAAILERLTSTQAYQSIGARAAHVARGHREYLAALRIQAQAASTMTPQEASELEDEHAARQAARDAAKTAHGQVQAHHRWLLHAEHLSEALRHAKEARKEAEAAATAFEPERIRLVEHQRCEDAQAFAAYEASKRIDGDLERKRTTLEQFNAERPGLQAAVDAALEKLEQGKAALTAASAFTEELRPRVDAAKSTEQNLVAAKGVEAGAKQRAKEAKTSQAAKETDRAAQQQVIVECRRREAEEREAFAASLRRIAEEHGATWPGATVREEPAGGQPGQISLGFSGDSGTPSHLDPGAWAAPRSSDDREGGDGGHGGDVAQAKRALEAGLSHLRAREKGLIAAVPLVKRRQSTAEERVQASEVLSKRSEALAKLEDAAERADATLADAEATEQRATAAYERQQSVTEIATRRGVLQHDEACPLCGSLDHPYRISGQMADDDAEMQRLLAQARSDYEQARGGTKTAREAKQQAHASHEHKKAEQGAATKAFEKAQNAALEAAALARATLSELGLAEETGSDALDEEARRVGACIAAASSAMTTLDELREVRSAEQVASAALKGLDDALKEAAAQHEARAKELIAAASEVAAAQTAHGQSLEAVRTLWQQGQTTQRAAQYPDVYTSPSELLAAQKARVTELQEAVGTCQQVHGKAVLKLSELDAKASQLGPQVAELRAQQSDANETLQALLGSLEIDGVVALVERRLEPSTLVELRGKGDAITALQTETATRLTTCEDGLEAHRVERPVSLAQDADTAAVTEALTKAAEVLQKADEQLQETDRQLAVYRAAVQKKADALAAQEEAERNAQIWVDLNELIGRNNGEKFKTFAQALNLGRLLQKANVHLARLTERYRLCACLKDGLPTLEFELMDLYQCEARVAARSLSGGERFLVSLALALGLSDFRGVAMPVETLLLDEGFGTLDPATLSTALSALGQLQSDGRQVGIISHVVGLEERIDARIKVVPMGGGRSRLELGLRG